MKEFVEEGQDQLPNEGQSCIFREARSSPFETIVGVSLAQLNRNVEGRAGHRPQLSDLREAGGIEQDGDVVMFIHRDPDERKPNETDYNVSLLIEKHRNGPKGSIDLHFVGSETRFYPLEKGPGYEPY